MTEFWEQAFKDKQEMWGLEPANSALQTAKLFGKNGYKHILIPGIGYGRNACPFMRSGMGVTGIEISAAAIELAEKQFGKTLTIYHGSVIEMPFDKKQYDGIYCHALIHLLDENQRIKLIADCYNQLNKNGMMVFTAITKEAKTYGQGTLISKDRFLQFGGVNMFFYDRDSIQEEFGRYGLLEVSELEENFPFYLITCKN